MQANTTRKGQATLKTHKKRKGQPYQNLVRTRTTLVAQARVCKPFLLQMVSNTPQAPESMPQCLVMTGLLFQQPTKVSQTTHNVAKSRKNLGAKKTSLKKAD